jgi:hypothetical protein
VREPNARADHRHSRWRRNCDDARTVGDDPFDKLRAGNCASLTHRARADARHYNRFRQNSESRVSLVGN